MFVSFFSTSTFLFHYFPFYSTLVLTIFGRTINYTTSRENVKETLGHLMFPPSSTLVCPKNWTVKKIKNFISICSGCSFFFCSVTLCWIISSNILYLECFIHFIKSPLFTSLYYPPTLWWNFAQVEGQSILAWQKAVVTLCTSIKKKHVGEISGFWTMHIDYNRTMHFICVSVLAELKSFGDGDINNKVGGNTDRFLNCSVAFWSWSGQFFGGSHDLALRQYRVFFPPPVYPFPIAISVP